MLFQIQLRGHIQLIRNIFSILFTLTHTLGKQILDLPIHRAEVVLRPGGNGVVQLRIQPQGDLLFRFSYQYKLPLFTMG